VRPSVLIIDEVGYLSLDTTQASLLFPGDRRRYEKQAGHHPHSNKAFSEWARVFAGDAVMASAAGSTVAPPRHSHQHPRLRATA